VGKTLLLQQVIPDFGYVLYCPASSSPQAVCRCLAELLAKRHDATLLRLCKGGLDGLAGKSFVSLKGIVSSVLRAENYLVVLDYLNRPSPALGALIGEFMLSCATPVIAVARSAHMEDAGSVSPLSGENLNSVLDSMVKSSEGNPGAILRMIAMAKHPKYRNEDHIKWSPLYIDFLLEWARENAL
jgi:hypothetical protein